MSEYNIRYLNESDWKVYRNLRLNALSNSPDAFGGTCGQAEVLPDGHWRGRLAEASQQTDCPLIAEKDGVPIGMAWGKIEIQQSATAFLFQMWVDPKCRGMGVGRELLGKVLTWAKSQGVPSIVLGVTCGNSPARRLYNSAGFQPVGKPELLREDSELLSQSMELMLQVS